MTNRQPNQEAVIVTEARKALATEMPGCGALGEPALQMIERAMLSYADEAVKAEREASDSVTLIEAARDLLTAYDAGPHVVHRRDLWECLRGVLNPGGGREG